MRTLMQSEVAPLREVLVKHPRDAFVSPAAIARQWRDLNYLACPDFERAGREFDRLVEILERRGVEVHCLPPDGRVGMDSLYARDASIVCEKGVILCNMGKAQRREEPAAQEDFYRSRGIPVCGKITGSGRVEGGDLVWLDPVTPAVAHSYRTNEEGIRQLREILGDCIRELIRVPLPHWRGPADVFHLMSIISPLDNDLALVYSPLMPVPFREALLARGIELVEVPDVEFDSMGCNVLALAPRKCLMLSGNPVTRERMEAHGVEAVELSGEEISLKGGGGPTCLTRPLVRG